MYMMNFFSTTLGKVVGLVLLAVVLCALYYAAYSTMGMIDKFASVNYDVVIAQNGYLRRVPPDMVVTATPQMTAAETAAATTTATTTGQTPKLMMIARPGDKAVLPENMFLLDDGLGGLPDNLCSRSCCADQWPTSFQDKNDPFVCANRDKFITSNIMCNNTFQDSGCMCLTKDQFKTLYK